MSKKLNSRLDNYTLANQGSAKGMVLIIILGPTSSGKSGLAVKLAKKFNGEVVSADSRQVYKKMDIGTGKITKKEMRGIPHYLLGVVSPKRRFTVVQYRKLALKAINKILKKNKIPILCGGTGFYIQAVTDGIVIPEVKPDWRLRSRLDQLTTEELFKRLKKLDPRRARTVERKNRRRLIRALEIVIKTKKPTPPIKKKPLPYPVLIIGIKREKEELRKLIEKRFFQWLKEGFLKEVKDLKKLGLSWKRIEEFGIHYRTAAQYLQKRISYKEMVENSLKEIENYAKRQITWFTRQNFAEPARLRVDEGKSGGQNLGGLKRDKRIHWVKNYSEAEKLVRNFLR